MITKTINSKMCLIYYLKQGTSDISLCLNISDNQWNNQYIDRIWFINCIKIIKNNFEKMIWLLRIFKKVYMILDI